MLATSNNVLIAVGALATAVFTGITAVVTYLVYRHGRHQAALRRPIRVHHQDHLNDEVVKRELPAAIRDTRPKRYTFVLFSNRTDADLRWFLDTRRTRLYRSAVGGTPMLDVPAMVTTPSHDGTTLALLFVLTDDAVRWADDEADSTVPYGLKFKRRYWLKIRGRTADGHKIKRWMRVDLFRANEND
jgi:hypothetical protein